MSLRRCRAGLPCACRVRFAGGRRSVSGDVEVLHRGRQQMDGDGDVGDLTDGDVDDVDVNEGNVNEASRVATQVK